MSGDNPFTRRLGKHSIGKSGRRSETRVSRNLGGRLRPASGAMEGAKGDMDLGKFLLEAKSTTSASMSVKHAWLTKIAKEARSEGKTPALSVSFVKPDGTPDIDGDWVMVPMYLYKELVGSE